MIITEGYKPSTQVLPAQNEGAAKQKTQTEEKPAEQPAYQVDISPAGEHAQAKTRREEMLDKIARHATLTCPNWTDEQKRRLPVSWKQPAHQVQQRQSMKMRLRMTRVP